MDRMLKYIMGVIRSLVPRSKLDSILSNTRMTGIPSGFLDQLKGIKRAIQNKGGANVNFSRYEELMMSIHDLYSEMVVIQQELGTRSHPNELTEDRARTITQKQDKIISLLWELKQQKPSWTEESST